MQKKRKTQGSARKAVRKSELTLRDHLSLLTYRQACRCLGENGSELIMRGGKYDSIDLDRDIHQGRDVFSVRVNGAVASVTLESGVKPRLNWSCSQCGGGCEHVGAAASIILEEKTILGLAETRSEGEPVESLGEKELVEKALKERRERADNERMRVKSTESKKLWTDYVVTSLESGKSYRVALRGWEPGDSYCSCPDFRNNTLGICKHVLNVQGKMRKKFNSQTCKRAYKPEKLAVHLRYGKQTELRLLVPEKTDSSVTRVLKPLIGKDIRDVNDLLSRIRKLMARGVDVLVYPDAEEYINRRLFLDRISATVAEIRKNPGKHPLRKQLLKAELLPYQLDGIAFAVGAGRAILADDMGLGKTIQGIGVAELFSREADIKRVLVICPTSLKTQWLNEINRFCERDCQVVLGRAEVRAEQYDNSCFYTICNYEQVLRDITTIERVGWDLIILDEGQRIKNWEAKTSRVVKGLRSPFALVLSGTPLENRLDDLYSVAQFVDDNRLGPAFRFFNRHRIVDERGKVLGYRELDKLREQLKPILLRRTRASVMRDLPPRTTEIVRMQPTQEQLDIHAGHMRIVSSIVRKPYLTEMDILRLQKALLMCRMVANSTFLADKQEPAYSSKLTALEELIANLFEEDDRKAVLFSEWTTMLGLIEPILEKYNIGYVRLDGSVPQKKRQRIVNAFQDDPECRMFITTNAGSTGLNLQSANTVINVDLPWNPAVLEQRIARAHRMGQKNPVQVYVLVTEGTIEEGLLGTLSAKHELALAALDVGSDVDEVELVSGIEELKRRLEVLLGNKPEAKIDESERLRQEAQAASLAKKEQVAAASGQLIGAAFNLLGELIPEPPDKQAETRAAKAIEEQLVNCLETDEQGRTRMTLTFTKAFGVRELAKTLARLTGTFGQM